MRDPHFHIGTAANRVVTGVTFAGYASVGQHRTTCEESEVCIHEEEEQDNFDAMIHDAQRWVEEMIGQWP